VVTTPEKIKVQEEGFQSALEDSGMESDDEYFNQLEDDVDTPYLRHRIQKSIRWIKFYSTTIQSK